MKGVERLRLGEVAAGVVLKHTRDFDLTRDATLSSGLAPQTPAYDVQQACATSLESTILRTLISVCAAGDLGVAAILESE
jgi:acetyl-CoA C-acetyltransferase